MPEIKALRGASVKAAGGDRRIRRSRAALTAAFSELALERSYPDIGIRDVAERANVGRSTLYSHFSDIDDLLAQSLDPQLSTIARCSVEPEMKPELGLIITHFWDQRSIARTMLRGDAGAAITRLLVRHLEEALLGLRRAHKSRSSLPVILVAEQLAAGQLAMLGTWLAGRAPAPSGDMAQLLHKTSYAAAMASL
ncbi:TetR/AcrR family transcriptional regulator [Polymorphobacter sp. PAMC 29334]|uniref:TetR/AcrR family transcriptional regulator n=1 Tax=Polymorphobacter sp. PAMC 29334 TaxID=2862331 RepID=UPI001C68367D|nr:TetR family transcriptional regulator [Polymorphobacter sp. PAMC 29334]QYE34223.1 TetR/AcrR family transcriptional regulator [Polymorphobacter sp. PAMC 29334]